MGTGERAAIDTFAEFIYVPLVRDDESIECGCMSNKQFKQDRDGSLDCAIVFDK